MIEQTVVGFPKLGIENITMNPVAVDFGKLSIRWYGILILLGVLTAVFFGTRKMKHFDHTFDDVLDILIFALPSAVIGCRLYYCAFAWDQFKDNPLRIITGWADGGLAFYGGLIGGTLAGLIVMLVKKMNIPAILDLYITQFPIAQAIGRWGNFVNGEAYGAHTDLPWGMTVANRIEQMPVHPTFLYESLWNLLGFILLYLHLTHRKFNGQNALMYLAWYGFGRFFIEGLRADSLWIGTPGTSPWFGAPGQGIRVSQMLSLILFTVSVVLLIIIPVIKKKRDARRAIEQPLVTEENAPTPFEEA